MKQRKLNKKGFTLVELLLVIAVLGIILGISIPRIIANTASVKLDADTKTAQMAGKKVETMIYLKNTAVMPADAATITLTKTEYGEDLPVAQTTSTSSSKVNMKITVSNTGGVYTVTVTDNGSGTEKELYKNTNVKPADY